MNNILIPMPGTWPGRICTLLFSGLLCGAMAIAENTPLVMLTVTGEIDAAEDQGVTGADQLSAQKYVKAVLGRLLTEGGAVRLMDEETMQEVRADAEKWAVLQGGGFGEVRKVLANYHPDFFIRATFHTSPLTRLATGSERTGAAVFWACGAGVTLEIIPRTAASPVLYIASKPMEESVKRLTPLETALVALDRACGEVVSGVFERNVFSDEPPITGQPLVPPSMSLQGGNVIMVTAGSFNADILSDTSRALIERRVEAEFGQHLATAFGLTAFDQDSLAKAQRNAQQWAVLQGGTVDQIRAALEPYALDACLRIRFHVPQPYITQLADGEKVFSGTAVISLEAINLKDDRGTKALLVESPPMGTNADPAFRALSVFDAATGALAYSQKRIVEQLTSGQAVLPDSTAPSGDDSTLHPGAIATAAVLWVKPDFKGWTVPRARQPALTRRHQLQVNKFIKEIKESGQIGIETSDYLVHGLHASGVLLPVENTDLVREDISGVRNKLLELRMAGWIGERLPYDDPHEAIRESGAAYTVTARITKIQELPGKSASMILAGAAQSEVKAWVEVTVTEIDSGREWTFDGEGAMSKTGWSTGIAYAPELELDTTLVGGAIRAALFNAAAAIKLE